MSDRSHLVVLLEQAELDPSRAVPAMIEAGIAQIDATRIVRKQRGILLNHCSEEQATALASAMTVAGYDALATPIADYPELPRALRVSRLEALDGGFQAPSLGALGMPDSLPWEQVNFVLAGLSMPASSGVALNRDQLLESAASMLQADAGFPLRSYLDSTPEDAINMDRLKGVDESKKTPRRLRRVRRFNKAPERERYESNHPGLEGHIILFGAGMLVQFSGHEAAYSADLPAGHWLRPFHATVEKIVAGCDSAQIPESTRILARGEDSEAYMFDDARSLMECSRWWLNSMSMLEA